jgi:hypothetical protein
MKVQVLMEGLTDEDIFLGECEVTNEEQLNRLITLLKVSLAMENEIKFIKQVERQIKHGST